MKFEREIAELDLLRQSLLERLQGVDASVFNRKPPDGGWSAAQVVAHLIAAERLTLGYLEKKTQSEADQIPPAGLTAAFKSLLLNAVLASPIKVTAPGRSADVPEESDLASLTTDWLEVRSRWTSFLEAFPDDLAERAVYKHPVAGRLNMEQTLGFLIRHLRRHSRQIERTLAAVG